VDTRGPPALACESSCSSKASSERRDAVSLGIAAQPEFENKFFPRTMIFFVF
jgi:hypothetical protein